MMEDQELDRGQSEDDPSPDYRGLGRKEFYRLALVSFLAVIIVGALVGAVLGTLLP